MFLCIIYLNNLNLTHENLIAINLYLMIILIFSIFKKDLKDLKSKHNFD